MQEKLIQFRTKHPIAVSAIIGEGLYVMALLLGQVIGILTPYMWLYNHPYLGQLLGDLFGFIITYSVICLFGFRKLFKPVKQSFLSGILKPGLWMTLISIYYLVNNLLTSITSNSPVQTPIDWIIFILAMTAVGMFEETTFRGFALNVLLERFRKTKKGIIFSLILSSFLFGCMHLGNLLIGAPIGSVLIQIFTATVLGIFLGAIYLRSGNLYVVIFLHAFFDASQLLTSGIFMTTTLYSDLSSYSLLNLIPLIPFVLVILIILRPSKLTEVFNCLNNNESM